MVHSYDQTLGVAYRWVNTLILEGAQGLEAERTQGSYILSGLQMLWVTSDKPLSSSDGVPLLMN